MANTSNDTMTKANGLARSGEVSLNQMASSAEKTVKNFSREAGEQAGMVASQISDSVTEAFDTSRDYVKANPVKGVAIAAAVGVVAGAILGAAMRKH